MMHTQPRAATSAGPTTRHQLLMFAAVVLALVFAHRDALAGMVRLWNVSPMYSYGFSIPFISAYLLWSRREELGAMPPKPSWVAGGLVLLLAISMGIAARAGGFQVLEQLAFLVALTGAALVMFGARHVRVAWAALAYLLLMIPVWDGLTEPLHAPFQRRSAEIGLSLIRAVGIPAFREGNVIALPNLTLEVARACSGVNYLVAVIALGLPLAYLKLRSPLRRIVLLISAVAVAAASNALRVALIGVLAHLEIGSPLHGPMHVLHGLFVAGIGYVVLFAGLHFLAEPDTAGTAPRREGRAEPRVAPRGPRTSRTALALVVLFVVIGSTMHARAPRAVALNGSLESFPATLGAWYTDPAEALTAGRVLHWPGADAELRRSYRRADGAVVDLYIAYFAYQQRSRQIASHQSAELHGRATPLPAHGSDGHVVTANLVSRDGHPDMVFWYSVDGMPLANRYVLKVRTLWNAILHDRTNGAVIVLTPRARGQMGTSALQEFAPLVHDALEDRLPGPGRSAR
jgi:EpsI family protein